MQQKSDGSTDETRMLQLENTRDPSSLGGSLAVVISSGSTWVERITMSIILVMLIIIHHYLY